MNCFFFKEKLNNINQKTAVVFLFFGSLLTSLCAEPFRTSSLIPYQVTVPVVSETGSQSVRRTQMGINDSMEIIFPHENQFIKGLEIEIRIPKIIASYRDSVVLYLYENGTKSSGGDQYDYEGTLLFKDLMPSRLSYTFRIPFTSHQFSENSPYAASLPVSLNPESNNLILRTQLAMKGVPDSFFTARFEVSVIPVLADTGMVSFELNYPEQAEVTVPLCYIDDILTDITEPVILSSGLHHVSIISEQYRNEMRTFSVEKAGVTELFISLQPVTTDISIQAPEGAEISLDGVPVESHRAIPVEPGDHVISYSFSDYEITKTVTIVRGKSYTISLSVDISIFEQD